MSRGVLRKLKRLARMSPGEFACRTSQALRVRIDRFCPNSSLNDLSDRALIKSLDIDVAHDVTAARAKLCEARRSRTAPRFFVDPEELDAIAERIAELFPDEAANAVRRADAILAGRFDILGYQGVEFGNPPRWNRDPVNGVTFPDVFWADINSGDARIAGDPKVIWELHRHQYFQQLGKAYVFTGDAKYAGCFAAHVRDWMAKNAPGRGRVWASSLELAFRAMSWLWAMHLFRETIDEALLWDMIKWLRVHALRIEAYLSYYYAPNTHLQGEGLGLWMLGTMLPELRPSERWRRLGGRILSDEIRRQIRPDGIEYEQSTYYHRYSTDFYLQRAILGELNGDPLESGELAILERMVAAVTATLTPAGTTPMIGDSDGGRALRMEEWEPNDPGALLSTAAVWFNDCEFKFAAQRCNPAQAGPAIETIWLLGPGAVERYSSVESREPPAASVALKDGGYFVMRSSWAPDADYLWVDCGPMGMPGAGHGHADTLAFELWAAGRPMIIDPGMFRYPPPDRELWRATRTHNTVTVDGVDQGVADGPFRWALEPRHKLHHWLTGNAFDYVDGEHDGYTRLADPVVHRRKVMFVKGRYWIVSDEFAACSRHGYEWHFHLAPGCRAQVSDERAVIRNGDAGLMIVPSERMAMSVAACRVSEVYGMLKDAEQIVCSAVAEGDTAAGFLLLPFRDEPPEVTFERAGDGIFRVVDAESESICYMTGAEAHVG